MTLKRIFTVRNFVVLTICALMILFIIQSDIYMPSVKNGLNLYVISVLPSMLPFFFFSKLLTELGFAENTGKLLKKPLKKLYNAPSIGGYIMIMSMLCGYPVGAKLISECYSAQLLNTDDAKRVCTFSSTSGPLFVVGTVGVAMFGNKTYGFILLFSHYLGAIINGLLYRKKAKNDTDGTPFVSPVTEDDILNKCMLNTFLSVGIVGGYITIFNMLLDVSVNTGLIPALAKLLAKLGVNAQITTGVAGGLIEMTKGCLLLSQSGFFPILILPLCQFIITFGGLSVTFQSLTFLSKTKISPAYYLISKLTQGIISAVICFLFCLLI